MIGIEAWIYVHQPREAFHQQARADQQNQRQSNFSDHQRGTGTAAARGAAALAFLEKLVGIGTRRLEGGIRPKIIPQRTETRKLKPSTSRLIPISLNCRISGGLSAMSDGTATTASTSPKTPPNRASRMLSVSNWRSNRVRLAPMVVRIEISRARTVARARRRFARFAQAISSTTTTAASRTSSTGRMSPTTYSCKGRKPIPIPWFSFGYCFSSRLPMVSSSALAC